MIKKIKELLDKYGDEALLVGCGFLAGIIVAMAFVGE